MRRSAAIVSVLVSLAIGLFLLPVTSHCQQTPQAPSSDTSSDVRPLVQTLHELQTEVQSLHTQLDQLRSDQQQARAEAATLRHELRLAISEKSPAYSSTLFRIIPPAPDSAPLESDPISVDASDRSAAATESAQQANAERIGKLEENQDLVESKLKDQYQTKIESSSKYKLRLSGIVLFNAYSNRGFVNNQDFPSLALEREDDDPEGTFGASFRQSNRSSGLRSGNRRGPYQRGHEFRLCRRFPVLAQTAFPPASFACIPAPSASTGKNLRDCRPGSLLLRSARSDLAGLPRRPGSCLLRKSLGLDAAGSPRTSRAAHRSLHAYL